jgi:DNA polymerase-3 subunit gamma/tau
MTESNDSLNPLPTSQSPYRVLARKYRPQTFTHLIGQDTLVSVISQGITSDRMPHAMILTGVRGVGKTTSARIIARSLNCIGPDGQGKETLHPCGLCQPCTSILEDRFVDVIEMDAASKTGVDDVRAIIETAQYRPVQGRYKVFIIDEVHMLSKSAFNALLKTLEEPPLHVKFIFATTEIRKVPDTVLSRCVRFDLRRLTSQDILTLYRRILEEESLKAEPEALRLLARQADGSARDALSLLDQAINLSSPLITETAVRAMLHLTDGKALISLFQHLIDGNLPQLLEAPRLSYSRGGDPISLLQDLAHLCHELTLLKTAPHLASDTYTQEEQQLLRTLTEDLSIPILGRLWQGLLKGIQETESHAYPLHSAEMVLVRLAHLSLLPTPLEALETLKSGTLKEATSPQAQGTPKDPKTPSLPHSFPDLVRLVGEKKELLMQATLRHDVHLISYEPGTLRIRLTPQAPKDFITTLRKKLSTWTGHSWTVTCEDEGGAPTLKEQHITQRNQAEKVVQEDPLYKEALALFPSAQLESVEIGENE